MARWNRAAVGSWLEGPRLPQAQPKGVRLGLPEQGQGSVAGFGARLLAFAVDAALANGLGGLIGLLGMSRGLAVGLAFLLEELVLVAVAGKTIGMHLAGIRVVPLAGPRSMPGPGAVLLRTVLLAVLIPAVVWDQDNRGLHDRLSGVAVLRYRRGQEPQQPPSGAGTAGTAPAARRSGRSGDPRRRASAHPATRNATRQGPLGNGKRRT